MNANLKLANGVEQIKKCSTSCLLGKVDGETERLPIGGGEKEKFIAFVSESRAVIPLGRYERAQFHILGKQNLRVKKHKLWERLVGIESRALMKVYQVCQCCAEVEVYQAASLEVLGNPAEWQRRSTGVSLPVRNVLEDLDFSSWMQLMRQLVGGLRELEDLGLSHGDPFPFNVLVSDGQALWIDFGNLSNTKKQANLDFWVFLIFTFFYSQSFTGRISYKLLMAIVKLVSCKDTKCSFSSLEKVLIEDYSDLVSLSDSREIVSIFSKELSAANAGQKIPDDILSLLIKSSSEYYSSFIFNLKEKEAASNSLGMERQKFSFYQREVDRLMVPKGRLRELEAENYKKLDELAGEKNSLLDSVRRYEAEVNNKVEESRKLGLAITKLEADKEEALVKYQSLNSEFSSLRTKFETLNLENLKLGKDFESLVIERQSLLDDLKSSVKDNKRLVEEIDGLTREKARALADKQRLQDREELLSNENNSFEKKIEALLLDREEITEELKQLTVAFDVMATDNESLLGVNRALSEKCLSLESRLINKEMASNRRIRDFSVLKSEFETLSQRLSDESNSKTDLERKLEQFTELNEQFSKQCKELASVQALVSIEVCSKNDLTAELSDLRESFSEKRNEADYYKRESDMLFDKLETIYSSRSMRYTRLFRSILRFFKHGDFDADRKYGFTRIKRRLSRLIPYRLKARLVGIPKDRVNSTSASPEAPIKFAAERLDGADTTELKNDNPLISVILPVFNQADLLAESIDSVLAQSYKNFELIVINDGSTDGVEVVLDSYLKNPRIKIYNQENQRLPKALSNGFSLAAGDLWTWTSADNIMDSEMLEHLARKLISRPDVDMIYADYTAIDDRGAILTDKSWRAHNRKEVETGLISLPQSAEKLNTVKDNFIGPCFMYRAAVGKVIGEYDPQLGVEDYDYWMRVNNLFKIEHLGQEKSLYKYRVHDNTLSAKADEHNIHDKADDLMVYEARRRREINREFKILNFSSHFGENEYPGFNFIQGFDENNAVVDGVVLSIGCDIASIKAAESLNVPTVVLVADGDPVYERSFALSLPGSTIFTLDDISDARVKMLTKNPAVRCAENSLSSYISGFVKSCGFLWSTRSADELARVPPVRSIGGGQGMHIVLQVDSFTQGGLENVVIDLAAFLKEKGFRVSILNLGMGGESVDLAKSKKVNVYSLDKPSESEYKDWMLNHNVSLINAHYSIFGAQYAHDLGLPYLKTIHNSYVWLSSSDIDRYRDADQFISSYICVSNTVAEYSEKKLAIPVEKLSVIRNGVSSGFKGGDRYQEIRDSFRELNGIAEDEKVFLNVASIMATKAQLSLVKAFKRVLQVDPRAKLILLGRNLEENYYREVCNYVSKNGMTDNVILAGYQQDVESYYFGSDVFVLPSHWEGWSLALAEAVVSGLFCVATKVGSHYEFTGQEFFDEVETSFGRVSNLDANNLSRWVYNDDDEFVERLSKSMIGSGGRESIRHDYLHEFACSKSYEEYAELFYDSIIESQSYKGVC